jgi:lipopolysaccharide assembly outer membrane protein LptD (OstA)
MKSKTVALGVLLALVGILGPLMWVPAQGQQPVPPRVTPPPPLPPQPPQPPRPMYPDFLPDSSVAIRADDVQRQSSITLYRGNVRIDAGGLLVSADEVTFNQATRELKFNGSFSAAVQPASPRVVPLGN